MIQSIPIENILFLDIETVPQYESYEMMPDAMKLFWKNKAERLSKEESPEKIYERAGIYAEFGKIICIGIGYLMKNDNSLHARIKSIYGHDEKTILTEFFSIIEKHFNSENNYLCAHNGKEFDFPYIARRAVVNRINIPNILQTSGSRPWEVRHIDTMELWRFGDYKNFTSLDLLAYIFGYPSPKDDISGKDVYNVYYHEQNIERIAEYCKKDVLTLMQVYLRYRNLDNLSFTYELV
ncbi:MAG: 3'-5' exonuclease [Bacteroidales bacterium]|nr:3'-5' exonuclease [Bacteroidales bacterium]